MGKMKAMLYDKLYMGCPKNSPFLIITTYLLGMSYHFLSALCFLFVFA